MAYDFVDGACDISAAVITDVTAEGRVIRLQLNGDFDPLLRALSDSYIEDIAVQEPTLEEIFLKFYNVREVQHKKSVAS